MLPRQLLTTTITESKIISLSNAWAMGGAKTVYEDRIVVFLVRESAGY